MLSREERHDIESQIEELQQQLDDHYYEKLFIEAREAEEKYLGKCYRKGDEFYRIVSVFTPECPHQLWAVTFEIQSDISPVPVRRRMFCKEDRYSYDHFKFGGIRIVKVNNNFIGGKPDTKMKEISQDEFMEAYKEMCKVMGENILKTFSFK